MNFKSIAVMGVSAVLLSACVTAPPVQSPLPLAKPGAELVLSRAAALDQTNHMTKHLDEQKNVLYFQNFGGGGAATGLLLGPIGVAANIKLIDSATQKDVTALNGKIAIDPRARFVAATERTGTRLDGSEVSIPKATPYLYVAKANPETLALAAALIIEVPGEKSVLPRKYMYQLPGTYSLAGLSALDAAATARIEADLEAGYGAILGLMVRDTVEIAGQEQPVKFKSEFLNPRFNFEMTGKLIADEGEIVWLRLPSGIYAVRRDFFQPAEVKKTTRPASRERKKPSA